MTCITGEIWHSPVSQSSPSVVVPSSKLARRIEPRQTTASTSMAYVATIQKAQPPYLLLATSVGYSVVCNTQLRSPSNAGMTQTSGTGQMSRSQPSYLILDSSIGKSDHSRLKLPDSMDMMQSTVAAHVLKSQPSYLILASSARNAVSHCVDSSHQSVPKSASGMGAVQTTIAAPVSSGLISVVSSLSTSSTLVSCIASAAPYLAVNRGGSENMVLQPAGIQSSPAPMATVLLPATPLVRVISNGSAQLPAVQCVLPSPTVQAITPQSPSNCPPVANFVQTSSLSCMQMANMQASSVRLLSPVGNTRFTMVGLSSSGCLPAGSSQPVIFQPHSQSHVVQQSPSKCLPLGSSQPSDIVGNPVSSVVWPSFGNSQSQIVQQSSSYYIPTGNYKSSGILGIPVSALPQIVLVGQNSGSTAASLHQLPHHSSAVVSVSQ